MRLHARHTHLSLGACLHRGASERLMCTVCCRLAELFMTAEDVSFTKAVLTKGLACIMSTYIRYIGKWNCYMHNQVSISTVYAGGSTSILEYIGPSSTSYSDAVQHSALCLLYADYSLGNRCHLNHTHYCTNCHAYFLLISSRIYPLVDLQRAVNHYLTSHSVDSLHCLLYTSPSPRDRQKSRMPSSA